MSIGKTCPFCGVDVQPAALACPHCEKIIADHGPVETENRASGRVLAYLLLFVVLCAGAAAMVRFLPAVNRAVEQMWTQWWDQAQM